MRGGRMLTANASPWRVECRPVSRLRRVGDRRRLRYPSNVDTVASVNLSGSNSPARISSKILIATSSTTGMPVSSNRAQACRNARFIASRRSSSLNVASPAHSPLAGIMAEQQDASVNSFTFGGGTLKIRP